VVCRALQDVEAVSKSQDAVLIKKSKEAIFLQDKARDYCRTIEQRKVCKEYVSLYVMYVSGLMVVLLSESNVWVTPLICSHSDAH